VFLYSKDVAFYRKISCFDSFWEFVPQVERSRNGEMSGPIRQAVTFYMEI